MHERWFLNIDFKYLKIVLAKIILSSVKETKWLPFLEKS